MTALDISDLPKATNTEFAQGRKRVIPIINS
jgi:hypothetical protein